MPIQCYRETFKALDQASVDTTNQSQLPKENGSSWPRKALTFPLPKHQEPSSGPLNRAVRTQKHHLSITVGPGAAFQEGSDHN